MYCPYCGAQIDDGLSFCTSCGQPLGGPGVAPTARMEPLSAAEPALATPTAPPKKKRTGLIVGIVVAAVVILAIVIGAFVLLRGSGEPTEVELEIVSVDTGGFPDEVTLFVTAEDEKGKPVTDLSLDCFTVAERVGNKSANVTYGELELIDALEAPLGTGIDVDDAVYKLVYSTDLDALDEEHRVTIALEEDWGFNGTASTTYTPDPATGESNEADEGDSGSSDTHAFKGITTASASSVRAGEYGNSYEASNVLSDNGACWCEGVGGDGVGEWIEFSGDGRQTFSGFSINAGYESSHGNTANEHYAYNNRPSSVIVFADGVEIGTFSLEDAAARVANGSDPTQTVTFASPVTATTIRIQISGVYPGNCPDNDTCISRVSFF